jgi:hypothetical protein
VIERFSVQLSARKFRSLQERFSLRHWPSSFLTLRVILVIGRNSPCITCYAIFAILLNPKSLVHRMNLRDRLSLLVRFTSAIYSSTTWMSIGVSNSLVNSLLNTVSEYVLFVVRDKLRAKLRCAAKEDLC